LLVIDKSLLKHDDAVAADKTTQGARRIIVEIKTVDLLQKLLDWTNKNIFTSFQLRLEMDC
jgi:hypothetical protein